MRISHQSQLLVMVTYSRGSVFIYYSPLNVWHPVAKQESSYGMGISTLMGYFVKTSVHVFLKPRTMGRFVLVKGIYLDLFQLENGRIFCMTCGMSLPSTENGVYFNPCNLETVLF